MRALRPTLRLATPTDAALLAELGARTFSDAFASDNRPEDMALYLAKCFGEAQQAAELADPRSTFLLSSLGMAPVGYAKLRAGDDPPGCITGLRPLELQRLYVEQRWLGRGVGDALMRGCLDEARRCSHRVLWLGVWEHNPRAIAFYRRWGFQDVGSHAFVLGREVQTDRLMQREV
jgi:ribosomal protein S18 acetylase RimI-like enzyme